jgi:hypothetical protein
MNRKQTCTFRFWPTAIFTIIALYFTTGCSNQEPVAFPTVEGWNGYEWGTTDEIIIKEQSSDRGSKFGLGGSPYMHMLSTNGRVSIGSISLKAHYLFKGSHLEGVVLEAGTFQSKEKVQAALVQQFGEPMEDGMWSIENFKIGLTTVSKKDLVLIAVNNAN